ncbi:MAG: prepilin peptidase [Patescibacteria group bacterium]
MSYIVFTGWFFYLFIFLLGLALGSFLNSWIWRTRENMKIGNSRSICPACRRQLAWYENIPVLSYLFLFGHCRTCKKPIPWHFTLVELGTALIFVFVAWYHINYDVTEFRFARDIVFVSFLIAIFVYDALYEIILSGVIYLAAVMGFIFNYFYLHYSLQSMLIGVAIAGGFFLLQYIVSKGSWIGGGDVRMGVLLGIWLGWPYVLVALGAAYIVGTVISLGQIVFKKKSFSSSTPFGTYLALGTFVAIFWGSTVVNWYLSLLK